jgi:hypothetical protein
VGPARDGVGQPRREVRREASRPGKEAGHGPVRVGHGRPIRRVAAAAREAGFEASDFELQEEVLDPRTAEVEARKGDLGVRRPRAEAVAAYPLGDGSDRVAGFAAGLADGRFGGRPRR